ncbi:S1C family serine protease [Bradyrhizobium valentinum]|uniref:Serine protease n=1 Tax=Bradyrhizobium valentinum TaxID=1518501 RepID=A0A0R3L6A8_9BRAD|nr:S1C family serine protease [Bradyrhizobium valentinum]KRR00997.1 serine protease [Bradyrhizobium valentinum]KRR05409.1 serine protease [Bradyrhizobium valentinum]
MTDPAASVLPSLSSALADIVARTKSTVVSVHSHRSRASGFVWKSGLIVTADEALADEGEVSIRFSDGTDRPARIAGRDHTTDIALLRFDGNSTPIALSSVMPDLGSLSVVVAAEHGVTTAALGMVSLVGERWRSMRGGEIDARIELDVRLRRSHEGGLVLNASGQAIGMAVQGVRRILMIPSATIDRVAGRLETHGRIARGYLGVGLQPVELDDGVGAMVMTVDRAGPSAAAGIRQGDIIVGWNNERLSGVRPLMRALGPDSVGSVVDVTIRRAGEPVRITLTIGERAEQ